MRRHLDGWHIVVPVLGLLALVDLIAWLAGAL
jgi:hypothetical protein